MAIQSFRDVTRAVDAMEVAFIEARATIQGLPGAVPLEDLRAVVGGLLADSRQLLDDLGALDPEALLTSPDGRRTIQAWQWRHQTRRALLVFHGQIREVARIAAEMRSGLMLRVITTREGDTWQRVAARELGDHREWLRLLEANPDTDPGALPSGTTLVIPERR